MSHLTHFIAQVMAADYAALVPQLGFGGVLLYVVVKRLEALEHTLRGLSKAMWMDLASRPYSEPFTKKEAQRMLDKMENTPEK